MMEWRRTGDLLLRLTSIIYKNFNMLLWISFGMMSSLLYFLSILEFDMFYLSLGLSKIACKAANTPPSADPTYESTLRLLLLFSIKKEEYVCLWHALSFSLSHLSYCSSTCLSINVNQV